MEDTSLPSGTVTFLFTDIEGSTKLLQHLGSDYPAVLDQHSAILRSAVARNGGRVVSTEGDSFFAVFRSAPSATAAAVEAQLELTSARFIRGAEVAVRMGIHTGEGVLGGDNYAGLDVNRAARVAAVAWGGQVVVTAATATLVSAELPEEWTLRDLGQHRLKDLKRPEHIFQLVVPGLRADFPPLRSVGSQPNNLPVQLTSFVGRRALIEDLVAAVRESRLVTLTGPGGTGKTRLSLEAAERLLADFDDGVFFVPLAPITNPGLVVPTIAAVLGLHERSQLGIREMVLEYLADRQVLLVLDNFEQLLSASGEVAALLRGAPNLKVVVSSRSVLHVSGEREFPVPPLDVPSHAAAWAPETMSQYEAVALFIERASAVKPGFQVTNANAPAVAAICARLDGLPLAIELAAARVRLLAPQAILKRLEESLKFLTGGAVDLPARQQTLRSAIAWSYDLLDDEERRVFRRLSVFRGGCSIEAAEALCSGGTGDGERDTVDVIASLADKSLLRTIEGPAGEPRFVMLETIREFGREMVEAEDETAELKGRHAEFFLESTQQAGASWDANQVEWFDRLEADHDNVRAALRYWLDGSDASSGLRMAAAIWRFWHLRGHLVEGRGWLEDFLGLRAADAGSDIRAAGLYAAGSIAYWQGDFTAADGYYREALQLFETRGDRVWEAELLQSLGFVAAALEDHPGALDFYRRSRTVAGLVQDRRTEGWAGVGIAMAGWLMKDFATALPEAETAVEVFRKIDDKFALASALSLLAQILRDMGRSHDAFPPLREATKLYAELGDVSGLTGSLDDLSVLATRLGHHAVAVTSYAASVTFKARIGGSAPVTIVRTPDPRPEAEKDLSRAEIDEAWRRGASMTPEGATAFILKELDAIQE